MPRIDIARLRKSYGMSQRDLARKLQVRQSFLSAIENGRSPLPADKKKKIEEIFGLDNLDQFILEPDVKVLSGDQAVEHAEMDESAIISRLLNRFHEQAHKMNDSRSQRFEDRIRTLEERNDSLMRTNGQLLLRNDEFRNEIDRLRDELLRLKEILISHSIKF